MAIPVYRLEQLPSVQVDWVRGNVEAGRLAMVDAAHQAVAYYVNRIKEERAVDTGNMMRGFAVDRIAEGATITNAAKYFPVMDEGRQAGKKRPPLDAILQWVLRKRMIERTM